MSLLVPSALVGLSLLAIPIIVHLLRPRKMRPTPFSSLRWLRETPQRASRRIQWHQWPLFLLRAGMITLLVLALAQPVIEFSKSGKPVDRVVVLDASGTMARGAAGSTPLDHAKQQVREIVSQSRAVDRTTVLLAGSTPRVLLSATRGPAFQVPELAGLRAEPVSANLAATLPLVQMLLEEGSADQARELIFVTDNLLSRWNASEIQEFAAGLNRPISVKVIDVSPAQTANAWIAGARHVPPRPDFEGALRVNIRGRQNAAPRRCVLEFASGKPAAQERPVSLNASGVGEVEFRLPPGAAAGQAATVRLDPPDVLPADDTLYVSLDPPSPRGVLIVEPETGVEGRGAATYWSAAIAALARDGQAVAAQVVSSGALSADDVKRADIVVLAGIRDLSDSLVADLEDRVREGAGLVVYLGPQVRTEFCNEKLHRALQPSEGLLPVALAPAAEESEQNGSPGELGQFRWNHPLLSALADPLQSDFAAAQFLRYRKFQGEINIGDSVLVSFDSGVPAIIEHPVGAGRVLLLNTSADDAWSDLPRRKCFVPLVDRLVAYLAPPGSAGASLEVGQSASLRLPGEPGAQSVNCIAPGGKDLPFTIASAGKQQLLNIERLPAVGIYQVVVDGKTEFAFSVNVPRLDSALVSADTESLRQWWSPTELEVVDLDTLDAKPVQGAWGSFWPLLVVAAGVLFLLEQLYVNRLCPRVASPVAPMLVRTREQPSHDAA
jgi:hypothetical protein